MRLQAKSLPTSYDTRGWFVYRAMAVSASRIFLKWLYRIRYVLFLFLTWKFTPICMVYHKSSTNRRHTFLYLFLIIISLHYRADEKVLKLYTLATLKLNSMHSWYLLSVYNVHNVAHIACSLPLCTVYTTLHAAHKPLLTNDTTMFVNVFIVTSVKRTLHYTILIVIYCSGLSS